MFTQIKCVIFDLDGVITETSNQHFEAWQAMARNLGIILEPSFEHHLKGISRKESIEKILAYGDVTLSEEDKERYQKQKNDHYQHLIARFDERQLFPGVLELLNHLKQKSIKIALGSASKNGPTLIKALGIEHYFDYVVDPSTCRSKPAPDIFLAAMRHFNLKPEHCLGIEDAQAGVKAIKDAGMIAIGIGEKDSLAQADHLFSSTEEASSWLMSHL